MECTLQLESKNEVLVRGEKIEETITDAGEIADFFYIGDGYLYYGNNQWCNHIRYGLYIEINKS